MRQRHKRLRTAATRVAVLAKVARTVAFAVLLSLSLGAGAAADPATGATQVVDQPGGDVVVERSVPLATAGPEAAAENASADAVYSNLHTFRQQSYVHGGATLQFFNTITRMAADDLNLAGTPPIRSTAIASRSRT